MLDNGAKQDVLLRIEKELIVIRNILAVIAGVCVGAMAKFFWF